MLGLDIAVLVVAKPFLLSVDVVAFGKDSQDEVSAHRRVVADLEEVLLMVGLVGS